MSQIPQPTSATPRSGLGCSAGVMAFVLTGLLSLGVGIYFFRDPMPQLDAKDLQNARERWVAARVDHYVLRLRVHGDQSGNYETKTQSGRPTSVTRDGLAPPRRTWSYWTVDGLFDVLDMYLEMQAKAESGNHEPGCTRAILQVEFDPQLGLPRRFRRSDLDNGRVVEWEVLDFSPQAE